jgi:hypothetical protein
MSDDRVGSLDHYPALPHIHRLISSGHRHIGTGIGALQLLTQYCHSGIQPPYTCDSDSADIGVGRCDRSFVMSITRGGGLNAERR